MPELPEVETIARGLNPEISGRRINAMHVPDPKVLDLDSKALIPLVQDATIIKAGRRAKILMLHLQPQNDKQELIAGFHLKMTGRLLPLPPDTEPNKHTRLFFDLESGSGEKSRLFFDDMRRFGYCKLVRPDNLHSWPFWAKLGPEPLEISNTQFAERFSKRKGKIKGLLLNQEIVVGIGNIYADESLFQAGIRPDALAQHLKQADYERLHDALVEILEDSIKACGSSIKDYRTAGGEPGAFQNKLKIYGRGGETCHTCGSVLLSMRVAGRGTVCCPQCQSFHTDDKASSK